MKLASNPMLVTTTSHSDGVRVQEVVGSAPPGLVEHDQRQHHIDRGIDQPDQRLPPADMALAAADEEPVQMARTGTTMCNRMLAGV